MEIKKLVQKSIIAAIEGGNKIIDLYENANDIEIQKKDDNSPLTNADREANTIIMKMLKETGLPILSEEGKNIPYEERKKWEMFWLVDPLDGTKEFIKRNGEFTVNIALVKMGKPIAGVVYVPVLNELYAGIEEEGAFKMSRLPKDISNLDFDVVSLVGKALPLAEKDRPFTVVGSRSHMTEETSEFIEQVKSKKGEIEFMSRGSSLKLCMIAEGKADIYPRFAPTMEWDTAAGQAIVIAAGFIVMEKEKNTPLAYNKENLLNPWFVAAREGLISEFF